MKNQNLIIETFGLYYRKPYPCTIIVENSQFTIKHEYEPGMYEITCGYPIELLWRGLEKLPFWIVIDGSGWKINAADIWKAFVFNTKTILTNNLEENVNIKEAAELCIQECLDATKNFGPFASAHEGYAIMLEEMNELWDAIKSKKSTPEEIKSEVIQIGAMAIRFLVDISKVRGRQP